MVDACSPLQYRRVDRLGPATVQADTCPPFIGESRFNPYPPNVENMVSSY